MRVSPDLFDVCANCQVRLTGIGGTYTQTADSAGNLQFYSVHYGTYAVQRSCRVRDDAGRMVTEWFDALGPRDNPALPYANIVVPPAGTVNFELDACPPSAAR